MSPRIPQCTPKELERVLFRAGFRPTGSRGSHRFYANNGEDTSIPFHPGDVPRPLVKQILRQAGLTEKQFAALRRGKKAA